MAWFLLISAVFLLAISAGSPGAELPLSFKNYQKVIFPGGGDIYAEHHKSCGDSQSANFLVSTPFALVGWAMTAC
jgi:hypothetical protein